MLDDLYIYNRLFKLRILHHMLLSKDLISYIDVTFGLMRQDQQNMTFISLYLENTAML